MHISAYLRTHTGGSKDTEEKEEDAHTHLQALVHTHPQDGPAGVHASCMYTH